MPQFDSSGHEDARDQSIFECEEGDAILVGDSLVVSVMEVEGGEIVLKIESNDGDDPASELFFP